MSQSDDQSDNHTFNESDDDQDCISNDFLTFMDLITYELSIVYIIKSIKFMYSRIKTELTKNNGLIMHDITYTIRL